MRRVLAVSLFALLWMFAQDLLAQASNVMTNQSVIALVSGKYGDAYIIDRIQSQPAAYSLTAADVQALERAGVSDTVIATMALKQRGGSPAFVQTTAVQTPAPQTAAPRELLRDAIPQTPAQPVRASGPAGSNARGRRRGSGASSGGFDCRFDDGDWPRVDQTGDRRNFDKVFYRDDNDCWQSLPARRITWSNSSMTNTLMSGVTLGMRKRPYTGAVERRYSQFAVHCNTGLVIYTMDFAVIPLNDVESGGRNVRNPLNREADFHVVDRHGALAPDDMLKIEPFAQVKDGEYGVFDYPAYRNSRSTQDIFSFHCLD